MIKISKYIIFTFLLLLGVFWTLVGVNKRGANDFPYSYSESVSEGFNIPQTWSTRGNGFGEPKISTLWGWPLDFLYGTGAKLNMDFSVLFRVLGIIPVFFVSLWGTRRLLKQYGFQPLGVLAGSLFYVINSYLILLIDGGQISIALAYAWFPVVFLQSTKAFNGGLKAKIFGAISICILGIFDFRFLYIFAVLVGIYILYGMFFVNFKKYPKYLMSWLGFALLSSVLVCLLNLYWILPVILGKVSVIPNYFNQLGVSLDFANLANALLILQPHWYKNVFGQTTPLLFEFFIIPIIALLAPILKRGNRDVGFWLIVLSVGVFLVKGNMPPFGNLYTDLLQKLPGFFIFRDPTKFFFLVGMAYAFLVAVSVDTILTKVKQKIIIFLLGLSYVFCLVLTAKPVWLNRMTGILSDPVYESEQVILADKLQKEKSYGRVYWIPNRSVIGFSSPIHPDIDTQTLISKRPFAAAIEGSYETSNFIRSSQASQLFDISGISAVVYPYPDKRRTDIKQDNVDYYKWFLNSISHLSWIDPISTNTNVPFVVTKSHQDKFFVAQEPVVIIGSDDIYNKLSGLPKFKLSNYAFMFLEEDVSQLNALDKLPKSQMYAWNKQLNDVVIALTQNKDIIFPSVYLDRSPNATGWWKRETSDLISWRSFLQEKYAIDNQDFDYGGGWSIAEGQKELTVPISKGLGKLLSLRIMKSTKGGVITLYQGGKLLGKEDTKVSPLLPSRRTFVPPGVDNNNALVYDLANFEWTSPIRLESNDPIIIQASGDINVVNGLILMDPEKYKSVEQKIVELIKNDQLTFLSSSDPVGKFKYFDQNQTPVTVKYENISPTEYSVKIEGLKKPGVLVFSENYNPMWLSNGVNGLRIYSFINGFTVSADGVYKIYFSPQRYVVPGLVISILTAIGLCIFIVSKRNKDR